MKIKKILLSFLFIYVFLPSFVLALDYKSGDIRNEEVSVSNDEILVTKKVSKTDEDFVYNVEFVIKGESTLESSTKNVYVSVIFDRSGSMLCANGTKTSSDLFYNKHANINNQNLYCMFTDSINNNKWENAVNGAISFSKDITENISTSKINLITFASDTSNKISWTNQVFNTSDFDYPYGATNLHLAVDLAKENLDSVEDNSLKYILIISDGEPNSTELLFQSIARVKNAGIKIYTVGYDTSEVAKNILKSIASGKEYYYDATTDGIKDVLKELATDIKEVSAGKDAVLIDTIGEDFSYISGEGVVVNDKVVTYSLGEISDEKKSFNFKIRLNDNLENGWYATNNVLNEGVVLKYKDKDNQEQKLVMTSSPEVYYEKEKYPYTINYYKDSISQDNLLGTVSDYLELDEIVSVDKDKYLPIGYTSENIILNDFVIGKDDNVLNIVYEKNNYPYHIEYYKDEISRVNLVAKTKDVFREYESLVTIEDIVNDFGEDWLSLYKPDGYKNGIASTEEISIDVENNVIRVLYLKEETNYYKILYYFNGKIDNSKTVIVTDQIIGTRIENIKFEEFDNYSLKEVINYPLVVSNNADDNVIEVFYELNEEIVLPPNTFVNNNINYLPKILFIIACTSLVLFVNKKYNNVKKIKK